MSIQRLPCPAVSVSICILELNKNRDEADFVPIEGQDDPMRVVAYCRACEFACPKEELLWKRDERFIGHG